MGNKWYSEPLRKIRQLPSGEVIVSLPKKQFEHLVGMFVSVQESGGRIVLESGAQIVEMDLKELAGYFTGSFIEV